MDFSIPAALQARLAELREFLRVRVMPLERRHVPFKDLLPELTGLRREAQARGWWLPQLAAEHGGGGLRLTEFALVGAELGRTPFGHFVCNCQAPDAGNMEVLVEFGTPEQQERWLQPLARGAMRSCFAMTEPDRPGSNPTWLATTARRDGDHYIINGRKWFTSGAEGAAFAVVMAVTDPHARPHERASQIIVPCDTPGFRIVRNVGLMGHAGSDWDSHAETEFVDCRVPVSHRLGSEGAGFAIAQARLGPGRIHHCMRFLGMAERAFEMMLHRAASREIAPGEPLATKQLMQADLADCRAQIDAARWLVLHTAWEIEQRGTKAARTAISLIKVQVARVLWHVLDRAIQAHGALGLTDDCVLSYLLRDARAARIYDGADEVHLLAAGKQLVQSVLRPEMPR